MDPIEQAECVARTKMYEAITDFFTRATALMALVVEEAIKTKKE